VRRVTEERWDEGMSEIRCVGIMTPGDMGSAVGRLLADGGLRVVTNLAGRSERTRGLAAAARIEDLGSDRALVDESDIVLSILVPDRSQALVERLAAVIQGATRRPVVVDCNAVAPATATAASGMIEAAGGCFVDCGIIGPPPRDGGGKTRFYASGPEVETVAGLRRHGLDVRPVSERVGDASAVKMCYAALTKGTAALMTQLQVVAARLGVTEVLEAEFRASQPEQHAWMQRWVPSSVPKAFRWVGEMEEIAKTFGAAGVSPKGFEGAAATWQAVARTDLGKMSVEQWADAGLDFEEVVRELARQLR
jgi:3-hydroxyisobutyrate dehydrogenase-like beta-hydroxyacid dehydrogenase